MPVALQLCTGPSERSSWRACSTAPASEPEDPTVLATLMQLVVLGAPGRGGGGQVTRGTGPGSGAAGAAAARISGRASASCGWGGEEQHGTGMIGSCSLLLE